MTQSQHIRLRQKNEPGDHTECKYLQIVSIHGLHWQWEAHLCVQCPFLCYGTKGLGNTTHYVAHKPSALDLQIYVGGHLQIVLLMAIIRDGGQQPKYAIVHQTNGRQLHTADEQEEGMFRHQKTLGGRETQTRQLRNSDWRIIKQVEQRNEIFNFIVK